MTAKEYLSQYKDLNDSINAKLEQVGELRRKAQTVSSGSSDGTHSPTPRDRIGEINLLTLDETAARMNYSYPQICRLHGRALQHVKMIWNDS